MKRKLVAAICILCLLIGCICIYNRFFAYVVSYNTGNACYRKGFYGTAMTHYREALQKNVPEGKECSIRINLALAMISTLGDDYAKPDQIATSVSVLENARDVLLVDNCATEEGDGHSEQAEQLKEEIEKMLEELKENQEDDAGDGGEDTSDPEKGDTEEADVKEKNIRQEIESMQEKAYQDRQEEEKFRQVLDTEFNFDYEGDIW